MVDQKRASESKQKMDLVSQVTKKMRLSKENVATSYESSIRDDMEERNTELQSMVRTENKSSSTIAGAGNRLSGNVVVGERLIPIFGEGRNSDSTVGAEGRTNVKIVTEQGRINVSVVAEQGCTNVSIVAEQGCTNVSIVAEQGCTNVSTVAEQGCTNVSTVYEQGLTSSNVSENTVSDKTAASDEEKDLSTDGSIGKSSYEFDKLDELRDLLYQLENIVKGKEKLATARLMRMVKSHIPNITGNGVADIVRGVTEHCSILSEKVKVGENFEEPQKEDSPQKPTEKEEEVSDSEQGSE